MNDYNKYLGKIAVTLARFEGMPEGQIVKIVAVLTGNSNERWVEERYPIAITVPKNCKMTPKHSITNHLWYNYDLKYNVLDGINPDLEEYYYINPNYLEIIGN